ncbi:MAG: DUF58 domain-containing protein [Xanthomonadales bacterium]|nr:DUF58 domain-containing protein [Xanthomonadales bacterium]
MFSLAAGEERRVSLSVPTERRGRLPLGQLRLSSVAPYGLFVCWSHLHPPGELIVYPRPERDGPPPPLGGFRARPLATVSGEEPQGVRTWRPGEPVRRIAWRASARTETLLSKEFAVWEGGEITLRYRELSGLDHEARIARLARWVLLSERAGLRYALELPGATIRLGRGPAQLDRCLRALALLP